MELYHNNINPFFFDTIKNNHKAGFPHLQKKKKKKIIEKQTQLHFEEQSYLVLFTSLDQNSEII